MLKVDNLTMKFGGLTALESVSLSVKEGSITALIGPNGAGKTTFFNCITGIYKPYSGQGVFTDKNGIDHDVFSISQYSSAHIGLLRTFQNIRLFPKMSVIENVLLGAHSVYKYSIIDTLIRNKKAKDTEHKLLNHCHAILRDLDLDSSSNEVAENLPYGKQKRLEIARALAAKTNTSVVR